MARSRPPETKSANLTVEQMRAAILKLERRIKDLETFDVGSIRRRFDPVAEALAEKVNGTLQDILGHDTIEYREYSVRSFDSLPRVMGGGPYPLPHVHKGYQDGIERCVQKLKALKELFEERIADALPVEKSPSPTQAKPRFGTRRVFVVHGHDDGTKETVARYLNKAERRAIGLTIFDYSVLAQPTELGLRSLPLDGLNELSPELRELALEVLRTSPIQDILSLSAYTPSAVEVIPIASVKLTILTRRAA